MFRSTFFGLAVAVAMIAGPIRIQADQMPAMSDADYTAKVMTGAPASVVKGATIVQMNANGTMRTIQTGSNGFTCMLVAGTPGCADKNAMAWMGAVMGHATPPDAVGFMYMLGGDAGASNTDPYARVKTDTNHWVQTGPHVMILGSSVKMMGYPMMADADPSKPYVMWADTPYAHLMIPVTVQP